VSNRLKKIQSLDSTHLKAPPSSTIEPSSNSDYFSISLTHNQAKDKYSIAQCDEEQKYAFVERINVFSQQNWQTLLTRGKDHGFESIPKGIIAIRPPAVCTDEVTKYLVMRCNGKDARIVGMRVGRVFEVFWYDPDLSLYPHD
jgi:hypothetical protein